MLLLYLGRYLWLWSSFQIYIPLCFYFIVRRWRYPLESWHHLHSTMLLLYLVSVVVVSSCLPTLHSTMLLLYLCDREICVAVLAHLHSTMLLLYPKVSGWNPLKWKFTFHYASTLSGMFPKQNQPVIIYIPLCFYFICVKREFGIYDDEFTFHYASTLSAHPSGCPKIDKIYIPLCFYFIQAPLSSVACQVSNLHSTMLLLYQIPFPTSPAFSLIYIPLCFYFIHDKGFCICTNENLHSTMLLLYRLSIKIGETLRTDLHSNMLLLYRIPASGTWRWKRIYIPLCFYFILPIIIWFYT